MKKTTLILGGISFMGAASAMAAVTCTPAPSCGDLGYSVSASSCSGDYLVCPFDTSKVHCINVPDQCTELGYTKVATNGTYTCPDGQTVSKCAKNTTKYKCDGSACSYGYYLESKMPSCSYKYCCKQAQYNNSSCYAWRDNSSYKDYEEDYARCKAASQSVQEPPDCHYSYGGCENINQSGPGFYMLRGSTGGNYSDACGNKQFEAVQSEACNAGSFGSLNCYYQTSRPHCEYIAPGRPGYDYKQAGWRCDYFSNYYGSYGSESGSPVCLAEYAWPRTYSYKGQSLTFTEYCYQKYNIWTNCGSLKFAGYDAIPYNWDHGRR